MKNIDRFVTFATGFFLHMNLLVGGGSDGAATAGGYGFRITDFVAVCCTLLLCTRVYASQRIFASYVFGAALLVIFFNAAISSDPRTSILALHYLLYGFASLYICIVVLDDAIPFCLGLIFGMVGSIGVFVLQYSGIPESQLMAWGLAPGYRPDLYEIARDLPRYSGLWSHPNEVGHVVALGAPPAAYIYLVQRRVLPIVTVGACLLASFYFCWSRGGLAAGGLTLLIAVLWPRDGRSSLGLIVGIVCLLVLACVLQQFDFISSRFASDPNVEGNIQDRLDSIIKGLYLVVLNPLGLSINDYFSAINSITGGVGSPHNGFLFFGGIFGIVPLVVLIVAVFVNLRIRKEADYFFALLTIQFCASSLFEQVSGSYTYVFIIALLLAKAFLATSIGSALKDGPDEHVSYPQTKLDPSS